MLGSNINKIFCDLTDYSSVKKAIKELKPNIVVHLAALSSVSYSYMHPIEVLETNILGSVNLIEACASETESLDKFIFASTSETYGNHIDSDFPLVEESTQDPNSPYSVSKKTIEEYLRYMYLASDFPAVIMRPFNTYGRKNDSNFVIERTITQMLKSDKVYLGDPEAIRDFMYVDDHISAYLKIIDMNSVMGETFNVCTGTSYSIRETAEKIKEITQFKGEINWNSIPRRPYDIIKLQGSNRKIHELTGWTPRYSLDQGIAKTIEMWRKK